MSGYFYQHLLLTNYIEEEIKFEKSFQHSLMNQFILFHPL